MMGKNKGQSLVEFVLILVVSVSLLLLLMGVFFKPFGKFLENYMGAYVACLLETGELPSLGNTDTTAAKADGCNSDFENFSLTGGRSPKGDSSSGDTTHGVDPFGGKGVGNSSNANSAVGGAGGGNGSNGMTRSSFLGSPSAETKSSKNSKITSIPIDEFQEGQGYYKKSDFISSTKVTKKPMSVSLESFSEEEKKQIQKKTERATTVLSSQAITREQKKTPWKKPPEEPPPVIEKDDNFTIGGFLRIIMIAAIIIAILIFVGGQVLQISRSSEK